MRYLICLILLTGCGGGGGGSASLSPATTTYRPVIHYGFFGDTCDVARTAAFTDFVMIAGWCTEVDSVGQEALAAKAAHEKIVLMLSYPSEESLRALLNKLDALDVLGSVLAIYPQDEPDVAGMSGDSVAALCSMVRRVAGEFSALNNVPLWAIYGNVGTDGIEFFDAVGQDKYGYGPMFPTLSPSQGMILVPGGAAPWREDPQQFVDAAFQTPNVVAVIPFIWRWPGAIHESDGIGGSYIEPKYRTAGCELLGLANC